MPGQYLYSSKIKRRRNHTWNSQLISFFPDIMCLFICLINISSQWQMQSMLLDNSYREQYACPCSTNFSICSYVISDMVSLKIFIIFSSHQNVFTQSDAVVLFPKHGSPSYCHFSQEHIQAVHRMVLLLPASG